MRTNIRSLSGGALMLVIIPIFAGLLACMPVPVGDPERSQIDPEMTGIWAMVDGDDVALYQFNPYDKRTWLITAVELGEGDEFDGESPEYSTWQDVIDVMETYPVGEQGIVAESGSTPVYKAWLTKLGGEQFLTWQPVGGFSDDGSFMPETWFVFRVDKRSVNRLDLYLLGPDEDAFEGITRKKDYEGDDYVKDMRRTWERAIAKYAEEGDFDDEPFLMFIRLPDKLLGKASDLFQQVHGFE